MEDGGGVKMEEERWRGEDGRGSRVDLREGRKWRREGIGEVLQYTVERNMDVEKGQDAVIQIVFCSDPRPSRTSWEWGSYQLEAGKDRGRYVAENLAQVPCIS
ncbi:hypothetical protein Pmani_034407 [Petrolisthes manimaculis]|uniref:Uncharacterized protein n=1 Tax=Petrolisthes manimaculis TaxID=1843537 RepID=A0AAE1NPF3_9EUCA|nr:hypothetical protein Pmani_034407 [Petrolisthes manimaculis]